MSHRNAAGRHRRTGAAGRHRAPRSPFLAEHGRYAVLGAALVAGVGVAGVSAATANATPPPLHLPAAQVEPTPGVAADAYSGIAPIDPDLPVAEEIVVAPASLSYIRAERKPRPVPVTAAWVNPLPEAYVTSCFGERWGRMHEGVDMAAPDGTPIRAAGAGVVVAAGPAAGYGNAVLIDHGNGYLTHYGHMSTIVVQLGQKVATGQQIGNEGSTGHSTGPHLHFEVHEGTYQNPVEPTAWMRDHGVDIPGCSD